MIPILKDETKLINILMFLLIGILLTTVYSIVSLNHGVISVLLVIFLGVTAVIGLYFKILGGFLASIITCIAIVIIHETTGVIQHGNYFLDIPYELVGFLFVGLIAGMISVILKKIMLSKEHWVEVAEGRAVHDEFFGTLKPKWVLYRIEEEMLRAKRYERPFSIALLVLVTRSKVSTTERIAALQALLRVSRAATQPPSVVSHIGNGQVVLVLPEHTSEATHHVLTEIHNRVNTEVYFPKGITRPVVRGIGKPIKAYGQLQTSAVTFTRQLTATQLVDEARRTLSY